jgi:hypothetical protein
VNNIASALVTGQFYHLNSNEYLHCIDVGIILGTKARDLETNSILMTKSREQLTLKAVFTHTHL